MIALAGYTFSENFGDTLMFLLYIRYLETLGLEYTVVAGSAAFIKRLNQCGIKVPSIDIEQIPKKVEKCIFIGGGYMGLPRLHSFLWQIRYFKNNPYLSIAKTCIKEGIPYYVEGVEVGPGLFPLAQIVIKKILNNAQSVVVRNPGSYKAAKGLGRSDALVLPDVVLGCFDKYLKGNSPPKRKSNQNITVGIHMTGNLLKNNFISNQFCNLVIDWVIKSGIKSLIFFEDYSISREQRIKTSFLSSKLKKQGIKVRVCHYQGIENTLVLLRGIDFIFTSKLHCGIVALSLGKYVVCIGDSPKLKRFYNYVNLEDHYLNFYFSTGSQKLSFLNRHLKKAVSNVNVALISDEINKESKKYWSRLKTIIST